MIENTNSTMLFDLNQLEVCENLQSERNLDKTHHDHFILCLITLISFQLLKYFCERQNGRSWELLGRFLNFSKCLQLWGLTNLLSTLPGVKSKFVIRGWHALLNDLTFECGLNQSVLQPNKIYHKHKMAMSLDHLLVDFCSKDSQESHSKQLKYIFSINGVTKKL